MCLKLFYLSYYLIMSSNFNLLLDNIKSVLNQYVDGEFENTIVSVVRSFFPNLNQKDINILNILTIYIIELVSNKYDFNKTDFDKQWTQNDNRDIKGIILLLLPFIDDKNNGELLKKLPDLNFLLYDEHTKSSSKFIHTRSKTNVFLTNFKYGNMGIGLIPDNDPNHNLNLFDSNGEKLIYKIIYHNFIGLLQTLEIMNGKYYVNWVNIVPFNLSNYNTATLYLTTNETYDRIKLNPVDIISISQINQIPYKGLWLGDIYNVIRNKFYEEGKKIKWLFFPYEISVTNRLYLINGLNKMFDLDTLINITYENFDDININDQIEFKKIFVSLIKGFKTDTRYNYTGSLDVDFDVIKYFLIYLINNYSNNNIFTNDIFNIFRLNITQTDEDSDDFSRIDFDKIRTIQITNINEVLQYIYDNNLSDCWNFLKESIDQLINTPYGKYLIIDTSIGKKISEKYYYEPFNDVIKNSTFVPYRNTLNLKNIYNISKSLSHNNTNDWTLLDKNYISFNNDNKINFWTKLTSPPNPAWINLNSNLRRQFVGLTVNPATIITTLMDSFKNNIITLVFEELISNGILNRFVSNFDITEKAKAKNINTKLKEIFDEKKRDWLDSYYYVTNKKFSQLPKMRLEKKNPDINNKYDELDYFDVISKDHKWPTFYAMDWISQISFFQHYIYHQVLYVTGATGQGKSTQVPKLLLYALKVIDYKSNGKVICTQPRIPPTFENATRIAEELGVPIELITNNSSFKVKTNNYYVQFKHQKDNHINTKKNHSTLTIVTDGTLLEQLKSAPTLKQQVNNKLINQNIYDIVIVDESHEHGVNMDLIIALSRQTCYINNHVRLIVVSATMDDDEPIYRRYFRNINDKLLFPIKHTIDNSFLGITNFLPEPMFMDRRYHISPPGQTTQFKVEEIYESRELVDPTKSEKDNANYVQSEAYKKIIDICRKTSRGEILFFANGRNEITKAVKYLNSVLPEGNIALPYYSELNEMYKNIIQKINIKISGIKNKRDNIYTEWAEKYIEDISVPPNIYKRAIIIATNVAEASVTIPGLKFVVDNGYAKVNQYQTKKAVSVIEVEKISESSRIQRKGRVGRVDDGTVYYMYTKNARQNIKPKYKITQEDYSNIILPLMTPVLSNEIPSMETYTIQSEKLIINPQYYDPNIDLIIRSPETELYYPFNSGLADLYNTNYMINNQKLDLIYYLDPTNNIRFNTKTPDEFLLYYNGQLFSTLMDREGNFYLIHPFEDFVDRNILNKVISGNIFNVNIQNDIIDFNLYEKYLNDMTFKNLICDFSADLSISQDKKFNKYYLNPNLTPNVVLTDIGQWAIKLSGKLQITYTEALTYIIAYTLDCFDEVYEINIILNSMPFGMEDLISSDIKFNQFKELYSNYDSDLIFIYDTIQRIKNNFSHLPLFNLSKPSFQNYLDLKAQTVLDEYKKLKRINKEPPKNFDTKLWNKLNNLANNGKLQSDYKKSIINDLDIYDNIIEDINKNSFAIKSWADTYKFNPNIITNFLKELTQFYYNKNDIINNDIFRSLDLIKPTIGKFKTNKNNSIILSYILARSDNVMFEFNNKLRSQYGKYLHTINPSSINTVTSIPFALSFYVKHTIDETDDKALKVSVINKINLDWLIMLCPQKYNPLYSSIIEYGNDKYSINTDAYLRLIKHIKNNWSPNKIMFMSEYTPINQLYYKQLIKYIK